MASDEIRLFNLIGRANWFGTEAQMRNGQTAGFFGIVSKIGLDIQIGMVADDLYRRFIGTDRTVGAKAPELAGGSARRGGIHRLDINGQGKMGYIIQNTHGKVVLRFGAIHIL